ncbi:MAG: SDR family NAD(P)-dependent oxidoreductase [Halobacteriaceae archaeon]
MTASTRRFADRTVVVTGAASGIGRATAEWFAAEGATVALTDVDTEAGRAAAADIEDRTPGNTRFHDLDVRDHEAVDAVIEGIHEESGVDVLVNNAGTVTGGSLADTTVAQRDRLVEVNVHGVWNGCRGAVPRMAGDDGGAIVNVASSAGLLGAPGLSTYSMTKAAVVNFTRALAGEVGPAGIRVNAVCPGTIDTPMARADFDRAADPGAAETRAAAATALDRIGEPGEVAAAIAFLASEASSFVTGAALPVDGGASAILRER